MVVLALVGIVVLGPDRLPGFARDAARMLRTLRDMATGARQQLTEELGPEFADLDLRSLNPRTAVQRAVFGDDVPDFRQYSPSKIVRDAMYGTDDDRDPERKHPRHERENGGRPQEQGERMRHLTGELLRPSSLRPAFEDIRAICDEASCRC